MRSTILLILILVSFSSFAQNEPYIETSFDVGVKITYMSKKSKDGSYPCSGQQCYHQYDLNQAKTTGNQGYLQFSYLRNRILLPVGIAYQKRQEELTGTNNEGIKLFGTTYYEHTDLNYKNYSEYGTAFAGFGFNLFRSSEKFFLGPMLRVNYSYLIGEGKVITTDESYTTTNETGYSGNATDYLNESEAAKHTLWSSLGLTFRLNFKSGIQLNFETGYDWTNQNSTSLGRIVPISGGVYGQMSFGYNLNNTNKK